MKRVEESFIFRAPFTASEIEIAITDSVANIEEDLDFIATHGYDEFSRQRAAAVAKITAESQVQQEAARKAKENLGTSFNGTPRDYQIFMLEKAKEESVICHLGTGMGKTLISIMLIKDFLSRKIQNKFHILFLVPSVALAVQHTDTLRANLPCMVETACHNRSNSHEARADIADAEVVVATHGAALDLLRHHPDVLSMSKVKLMIMDECHYATSNHNYATILNKFYHTLPREHRPRVLGLTASPLINVALKTTEAQLQSMLARFENLMDAKLYGFPTEESEARISGGIIPIVNIKVAEESVISYNSASDEYDLSTAFPSWENLNLHKSRAKELERLKRLCTEVGLCATAAYTEKLFNEVNRNEFDKETQVQYEKLKLFLADSVRKLKDTIVCLKSSGHDGHTTKMRILENLLTDEVQPGPSHSAPVGVCFCEERITVLALYAYFNERRLADAEDSDGALLNGLNSGVTSPTSSSDSLSGRFDGEESDDSMDGRFDDAEGDYSLPLMLDELPIESRLRATRKVRVRPDFAVRHATQIFKYLARNHRMSHQNNSQHEKDWMHRTKRIREVISKLRRRETNVLFATSVVEEGVDVEACSFIVSFDGLKTIKSYIQMKGRARMKHAKFFVFSDESKTATKSISLHDAQLMERFIHQFIITNERKTVLDRLPSMPCHTSSCFDCEEEKALHEEEYTTTMGIVDLSSSKSLLNRFALSVPSDPSTRTSKDANTLHMPMYTNNKLLLPSHIPPHQREVELPSLFLSQNKKRKHALLALAACVRLHKLGLLNERLLPLSDIDMKALLLEKALIDLPLVEKVPCPISRAVDVHIYRINQSGYIFGQHEVDFRSRGRSLALFSTEPIHGNIPSVSFTHRELGQVDCSLDYCQVTTVDDTQWQSLTLFHTILFNVRWRRKRKASTVLCFDESHFCDKPFPCYVVGCLQNDNIIDWPQIQRLICHYLSLPEAKQDVVQHGQEEIHFPTVWSPTYAPNASYIVYGPAGKTCQECFPTREYSSYQDYYATKYHVDVDPLGQMFSARRMFDFPQSFSCQQGLSDSAPKEDVIVEISQELCTEGEIIDPFIMLHLVMLPQILYYIDRHLTAMSFTKHCMHNFKNLGKILSQMSISSVLEALTAKSCAIDETYDRLEWLGDGVLKLVQTDALLKLPWTSCLHEGYLSMLRSAMGSNDRLKDAAKASGIGEFILIEPLRRNCWKPCGLRLFNACQGTNDTERPVFMKKCDILDEILPSEKVYADVVEAILGLIYIKFGIKESRTVACELGVSFPHDHMPVHNIYGDVHVDQALLSFARDFLGVENFNNKQLLVEATTHQTCLHKPVPSYQRLEWVGDAVLCLAAREWLFCRDENNLTSVGELVALESTLVCNEALAHIGFTNRVHRFIDHRDAKLPGRFSSFEIELKENERGLWGTDPPKVIPDVVEALIGAVHIDLGFHEGQRAALHVIKPMTSSISCNAFESIDACFLHPKQHLFEMAGTFVSVRAYLEEDFLRLKDSSRFWKGKSGTDSSHTNSKYIGVVRCSDVIVAVARESSHRAAINVACALAVEIFKANPQIIDRLRMLIASKNRAKFHALK